MTNPVQILSPILSRSIRFLSLSLAFACVLLPMTLSMQAQTFSVLHYFTGGTDGASPYAGVTIAPSGVLYGTAEGGGTYGAGTVFKLRQVNSSWLYTPLYEFTGVSGESFPQGGVVFGPNGALYGTTFGDLETYGTVFELTPPPTFCGTVLCYWNQTVLHTFTGTAGGGGPQVENLVFDSSGNIYGTT